MGIAMHKSLAQWAKVEAAAVTAGSTAQATNVLQMALDDLKALGFLLDEMAEYFDKHADADMDQDGYVPNTEMRMLVELREAANGIGY